MTRSDRESHGKASRLVPPYHHERTLADGLASTKENYGWKGQQTTHVFLRVWASLIDSIGDLRPYGADDYLHRINYRVILHLLQAQLLEQRHLQTLEWLQKEVDELDQIFLAKSTYDQQGLLAHRGRTNPAYWFLRRLPVDANVVDHLLLLDSFRKKEGRDDR